MTRYIFDLEADGLLDTISKIHCLCYRNVDAPEEVGSITDPDEMRTWVSNPSTTKIGHNIIQYDCPAIKKILGVNVEGPLIDTLPLAWYLEPLRNKYGLEGYGEQFGVAKPKISDWHNQTSEDYIHRCTEDTKINTLLFKDQERHLRQIYGDQAQVDRFVQYIMFKMDCIKEQEELGLAIDIPYIEESIAKLSVIQKEKRDELKAAMPRVPIYKVKKYPACITRKDGTISCQGEIWFELLKAEGLPVENEKEVKTVVSYKEPNPGSSKQLKDWLFSLGWVPENIAHKRNKKTGEVKKVPQIASKEAQREGSGEICPSIKKLYDKEPKLEAIEGLSLVTHRINLLKGFLRDQRGGKLYATTAGLTNTLRLQHSIVVNLPGVDKKYGKEVRGAIIPYEGHILCGSDLSGVEDNTKRHYIYFHDPEYVEEMNTPGFDAHLDIGLLSKMITPEEVEFYKSFDKSLATKEDKERYASIKSKRNKTKIVNFSCTYKIGVDALARNSGLAPQEAKRVKDTYWKRNWAILKVEEGLTVKTVKGQMWQLNPVSKFWYSLRAEKDKFSTLNQGTAVYVFDIWLGYIRKAGIKVPFQYHDEWLTNIKPEDKESTIATIKEAMRLTNEQLKLNVQIGCSVEFGHNYAETH